MRIEFFLLSHHRINLRVKNNDKSEPFLLLAKLRLQMTRWIHSFIQLSAQNGYLPGYLMLDNTV